MDLLASCIAQGSAPVIPPASVEQCSAKHSMLSTWTTPMYLQGLNHLLCVPASELQEPPEGANAATRQRSAAVRAAFWRDWADGKPVIVRGLEGAMCWSPNVCIPDCQRYRFRTSTCATSHTRGADSVCVDACQLRGWPESVCTCCRGELDALQICLHMMTVAHKEPRCVAVKAW